MTQPNKMANYGDQINEILGNVISSPRLEFDDRFYALFEKLDDPASEFSRIITEIISLHVGPINEFILQLPWVSKHKITSKYLNKWFTFLSTKGVKHIELVNDERDLVQTPSSLFSCQGLTCLKLDRFNLSIQPGFTGFKSLLHLRVEFMTFELGALESLLSGCPLLEELAVLYCSCSGCECIDLSSFSALIDLALSLPLKFKFGLNKSLPMIQRLTLELKSMMLLYADNFPLSELITSLKYLNLDCVNFDEREELLYIISVLKSASNLVELDIATYDNNGCTTRVPDPSEELECGICCLSELQKANIRVGISSKHALSLARFILANSSSLKTLTFDVSFALKPDVFILSSISCDLLRMERASQRAQVEFIHQNMDHRYSIEKCILF